MSTEEVPLTPLTDDEKRRYLLRKGDLLFNWRNGSPDHVGKTAYFNLDGDYAHVSFLLRLRFDMRKHDSRFYQFFLNNLRSTGFFGASKHQVNRTYNQTELGRLEVVVPPLEEQKQIADFLKEKLASIDAATAESLKFIELLREYRSSLITAAVTGKIDVRQERHG